MNQSVNLYYLYCMNMHCQLSVYHNMVERQVPFTAENLIKTHVCTCCNQDMASAMDIEIKQLMTEVASVKVVRKNYMNN